MTLFLVIRFIYFTYFKFPHFKVLKAQMRKWVHKGEEQLITYYVQIKTKKNSSELCFDELWIDEKKYKFHLSREDRKIVGQFEKKEKLSLSVLSEINLTDGLERPAKSSKGKLLLGYTFRNKKKFLCIKKLKVSEELQFTA